MTSNNRRILGIAFSLLVIAIIGYVFSTILIYILIAAVVGFIGDPVVTLLRRIRFGNLSMPRWLAALITLFAMAGLLSGLVAMFVPLVTKEIKVIAGMDVDAIVNSVNMRLESFGRWLNGLGLDFDANELYRSALAELTSAISLNGVSGAANNLFSFVGQLVAGVLAVIFMSFFFLKDGNLFYRMVFTVTPPRYMEQVKNILQHSHRMLSRYFAGLVIQVLIVMSLVTLGLSIAGVRNAVVIGVFAGLANIIPYIGPIVAASFALVVGITTGLAADPDLVVSGVILRIVLVFGAVQFIDNWILQPFVLGSSVRVHPLELFIVFLAAATLGGILGMALALPVYTILRIVAREFFVEFRVVESLTRDIGD